MVNKINGESITELKSALERIKALGEDNMSSYQRSLVKWDRNVDKRYAWVILVALWFLMCATLGPYRIYGLIYAKTTSEGIYTREEASWPVSTIFTTENLIGPFVSVITYHMSYRQSMLVGVLLMALGNGLTASSNSLLLDVILLGVVQGIGYAFIFMPFMEIINNYFVKYRNFALGIALCGGTMSIFVLSPLFRWLLNTQPWRTSYLAAGIICGLNLLVIPLLKPNTKPKPLEDQQEELNSSKLRPNSNNNNNNNNNMERRLSRISIRALAYQNSFRKQTNIMVSRPIVSNPENLSPGNTVHVQPAHNRTQRHASIVSVNPFASSVGLERKISRPFESSSIFSPSSNNKVDGDSGGVGGLASVTVGTPTTQVNVSGVGLRKSSEILGQQYETVSLSTIVKENENNFDSSIIWTVLKTPAFHLIWFNELVYFWIFSIYCLVLVDYGESNGCSREEAETLLHYQSIGELVGRLVLTVVVDLLAFRNKSVVIGVLLILATLMAAITCVQGLFWMASITVLISMFASLLYIMINGLLVDYLGDQQVTIGYGMASSIVGVFLFFRPHAVGFSRDHLGSYDPLFQVFSGCCVLGAFLWVCESAIAKFFAPDDFDD